MLNRYCSQDPFGIFAELKTMAPDKSSMDSSDGIESQLLLLQEKMYPILSQAWEEFQIEDKQVPSPLSDTCRSHSKSRRPSRKSSV